MNTLFTPDTINASLANLSYITQPNNDVNKTMSREIFLLNLNYKIVTLTKALQGGALYRD